MMQKRRKSHRAVSLSTVPRGSTELIGLAILALIAATCAAQGTSSGKATILSPSDIDADLRQFAEEIERRSAAFHLEPFDLEAELAGIRERATSEGLSRLELGFALQRILGMTGDSLAQVLRLQPPGPYLPFVIEAVGNRFVAFYAHGSGFLREGAPYLLALDDRPVADWLELARDFVPGGSPVYQRRAGLDLLSYLPALRSLTELPQSSEVSASLLGPGGIGTQSLSMPLVEVKSGAAPRPRRNSELLDDDIAYLRLSRMNDPAVLQVRKWMPSFARSRGLIIDLRGNEGKSRLILQELYPYLAPLTETQFVALVSQVRPEAGLGKRELRALGYRDDDWSDLEQDRATFLKKFAADFAPQLAPETPFDSEGFGPRQYLVLERPMDDQRYPYRNNVVMLMDDHCQGATDILLAACKGRARITLMGTASAGTGDGTVQFELTHSELAIEVSPLVSFLSDGRRLGLTSIQPDIIVPTAPEFFVAGGEDAVLDKAIQYLKVR